MSRNPFCTGVFFEEVEATGGGVVDEVEDVTEEDGKEEDEDDDEDDKLAEGLVVVVGFGFTPKNFSCCCKYFSFLLESFA